MHPTTRFGLFALPLLPLVVAGPLRVVFASVPRQLITTASDITCPDHNGTHYVGVPGSHYVIECGSDRSGVDMPDNPTSFPTFSECIDHCAKQERRCMSGQWRRGLGCEACGGESEHESAVIKREEEKGSDSESDSADDGDSGGESDEDQKEIEIVAAPVSKRDSQLCWQNTATVTETLSCEFTDPSAVDISWNTANGPEPPRTTPVYWNSAWGQGPTKTLAFGEPTMTTTVHDAETIYTDTCKTIPLIIETITVHDIETVTKYKHRTPKTIYRDHTVTETKWKYYHKKPYVKTIYHTDHGLVAPTKSVDNTHTIYMTATVMSSKKFHNQRPSGHKKIHHPHHSWHLFPEFETTTACTTSPQIVSSRPSDSTLSSKSHLSVKGSTLTKPSASVSSSSYVVSSESKIADTPVSTRAHFPIVFVTVTTIESRPASSSTLTTLAKRNSQYSHGHPHAPHSTAQWVKSAEPSLQNQPHLMRRPWFQTVNPGYSTARLQMRAESTPAPEAGNDVEYVSVMEYWPIGQLEDEKKYETVATSISSSSSFSSSKSGSSNTPIFKSLGGVQPTMSRIPDHRRPIIPFLREKPAPESSVRASSTGSSSKSSTRTFSIPAFSSLASSNFSTSRRASSAGTSSTLISLASTSSSEISTQTSSTPESSTMGTSTSSSSSSITLARASRPTGAPISKPTHQKTTISEPSTPTPVSVVVITMDPVTHTVFVPIPTPSSISPPTSLSYIPVNPSEMNEFGDGPWDHEGGKGAIHQQQESSQNYENHVNQGKKEKDSDGETSESWNEVDTKYNSKYKSETGYEGERDKMTKEHGNFEEDGVDGEITEEWDYEG